AAPACRAAAPFASAATAGSYSRSAPPRDNRAAVLPWCRACSWFPRVIVVAALPRLGRVIRQAGRPFQPRLCSSEPERPHLPVAAPAREAAAAELEHDAGVDRI